MNMEIALTQKAKFGIVDYVIGLGETYERVQFPTRPHIWQILQFFNSKRAVINEGVGAVTYLQSYDLCRKYYCSY